MIWVFKSFKSRLYELGSDMPLEFQFAYCNTETLLDVKSFIKANGNW